HSHGAPRQRERRRADTEQSGRRIWSRPADWQTACHRLRRTLRPQGQPDRGERLLSISGEDTLTVNRKYRDQWTGKLPSRLHVISNELPRLGDASTAVVGRIILLLLTRSWLGKEDHEL